MHKKSRAVSLLVSYLLLLPIFVLSSLYQTQIDISTQPFYISKALEEGFCAGTLIKTPDGYESIENISIGDIVIDAQARTTEVIAITHRIIDKYIQLDLQDTTVSVGCDQQLYFPLLSSWVKARDISCHKKCITKYTTLYALTTASHTLVVTPQNLHAHNATAILCGAPSICCGYIAITHPVIAMLGGLSLSLAAVAYNAYQLYNQQHLNTHDYDVVNMPDSILLAERFYYEERKESLHHIKQELIRVKNGLQTIKGLHSPDITHQLFSHQTYDIAPKSQLLSIAQEKKLSDLQKSKLRELRENELALLEKQIGDIQFALALHVNQVIENVEYAQKYYDNNIKEIRKAVEFWNNNRARMTIDHAYRLYKYDLLREHLLSLMQKTFNGLFLITQYYGACISTCIQKTTTINQTLEYLAPIVAEKKQWIAQEEKQTRNNSAIIERYFGQNGISVLGLRNQAQKEFDMQQKQRDTVVIKKLEAQQQQYVCSGFAGGPKKEDDDEKNLEKIKISEQDTKHIFRNADGHFKKDTPQVRKIIEDIVADKNAYNGLDEYGTQWYSQIRSDGQQVWAGVRNGKIRYAGINKIPWPIDNVTGLLIRPTNSFKI